MLERLYTPFDRLGADERGVEGTGLGLALSKRLVEAMNGSLLVESWRGDGHDLHGGAGGRRSAVGPSPSGPTDGADDTGTPGARGTVLYIEDNLANLRLVERIIGRRPELTLISAMQGSQGLELARSHRPQAIILDLHLADMPGRRGAQRACARIPERREIPVVILSADATPGQITRLLAQGAHAYLTKPLDVAELLACLDNLFEGR